ncbi:hypothetical protein M573_125022 [Prevotella intermedia ZT]|uniref:Uncharacterized protein n=1 Tax=Prevotella intermedia ZT TaxID=1347790 RepID=A0AAP0YVI5_PREIN|nr:hypothetical protein M573_125022 [Prevotella intermedia ZT]
MHGKSGCFALQNSRFRSAKSKLPFFFGIFFTKQEEKLGIGKKQKADNMALCFHFAMYIL